MSTLERFSQKGTPVYGAWGLPYIEIGTQTVDVRLIAGKHSQWVKNEVSAGRGIREPNAVSSFSWKIPKIPYILLPRIMDIFYEAMNDGKQMEKEVWVLFDGWEYEIYIPEQNNKATSITGIEAYSPDKTIVLVIHSHGMLPPRFSATDNRNEIYGLVYGVAGGLLTSNPSQNFRFGWNGEFLDLELKDVFEFNDLHINPNE